MSAVGLTKAMRAALETRQFSDVMFKRAQEMGLAAPRMTHSQMDLLAVLEEFGPLNLAGKDLRVFDSLKAAGFATGEYAGEVLVALRARITPSGLKALNDVRAATGDERWNQ